MLLLCAAGVGSLFLAARAPGRRPHDLGQAAAVVVGVPDHKLRFAAYNVYHNYRGLDRTVAELRKLDPPPDFVLLAEVEPHHVAPMAKALAMSFSYHPSLGQAPKVETIVSDVAILSKHPLVAGKPMRTRGIRVNPRSHGFVI